MDGAGKLWNDISVLDTGEVERRTGIRFIGGEYLVPFLGQEIHVDPVSRSIEVHAAGWGDEQSNHLTLALLSFLVSGEKRRAEGTWITGKDLPGGSLFFQGPHGMPAPPLIDRFGSDAVAFVEKGLSLGGRESEFGDGSVELEVLPGVNLCIVLWEKDDEFPASCTFMFDASFRNMLALDVVLGLLHAVVGMFLSDF